MAWVKVDDRFASHPKALRAGADAVGLWTIAACHCAAYRTDGLLQRDVAPHIPFFTEERAQRLIACGLWERTEAGDYLFHDWLQYQISASDWERKVEAERTKKRRQRSCPPGTPQGTPEGTPPGTSGSGSPLDPDPISSLDPDPISEKRSEKHSARAIPATTEPLPVAPAAAARLLAEHGRPRVVLPLTAATETGLQHAHEQRLCQVLREKRPTEVELRWVCRWINQPGVWTHLRAGISAAQLLRGLDEAIDLSRDWDGRPIAKPGRIEPKPLDPALKRAWDGEDQ